MIERDPRQFLDAGLRASADGRWDDAVTSFGAALLLAPGDADAMFGLADAQWWRGEIADAVAGFERAYAAYLRAADRANACNTAIVLALVVSANVGNRPLANGWALRAARLADESSDPGLRAWALVTKAALADDPEQAREWVEDAMRLAPAGEDLDLQLCALSVLGSAAIQLGEVEKGVALLDEALAGALAGDGARPDTVVFAGCVMVRSCTSCADFPRLLQWEHELAVFGQRYGSPYLNATCRASVGTMLVWTGDWARAESELAAALELSGAALPPVRAEALAALAELRLAQGAVGEARHLLADVADQPVALGIRAAIHLATGDLTAATALARQRLASAPKHRLEGSRMREILGETLLAKGDLVGALVHAEELARQAESLRCRLLAARGERLLGRTQQDREAARAHLERALTLFTELELPLEAARTRLALAGALADREPEVAVWHAQTALAKCTALGARHDEAVARSWLAEHVGRQRSELGPLAALTAREVEVLTALRQGLSNPDIAQQLVISRRTVEHHVANILAKLGLRNRSEAAAYAERALAAPRNG